MICATSIWRLTVATLTMTLAAAGSVGAAEPAGAGDFFDGVDAASKPVMESARQRIEQLRKGDFNVRFVDAAGKPVVGKATIRLVRHEFRFGCNITPMMRAGVVEPFREQAKQAFLEVFDTARLGNFWQKMEPQRGGPLQWADVDADVAWARAHDLRMRFHCLIYNFEYAAPKWSREIKTTEEWWPLIEGRIRAVAERCGDTVDEYDVINEMLLNATWAKENNPIHPPLSDPDVGARIFRLARKYLPKATLVSLEAGIVSTAETNTYFKQVYEYHKALLDRGAPVDVIGYQGHFYASGNTPFQRGHRTAGPAAFTMKSIDEGLDRLASLGKPIHVTEFNPPSRSNKVQGPQPRLSDEEIAAWAANFYTLVFSKPYTRELTHWFMVDEQGGRAIDGGLMSKSGEKKTQYFALRKLIKEDWTTRWEGELNAGAAAFRGFYGTYEAAIPNHPPVRFDVNSQTAQPVTVSLKPATR